MQFDRPTIAMNKLVAGCMEGLVVVWDMHTHHPTNGFASATYCVQPSATLFAAAHLPQNRCVCRTTGVCVAHPYQASRRCCCASQHACGQHTKTEPMCVLGTTHPFSALKALEK